MRTYYDILQLKEDCDAGDIKRQYRLLAKKFHPDLNRSAKAHEQFIAVKRAYKTLSDPKRRAHYDRGLKYIRSRDSYDRDSYQRQHPSSSARSRYKTDAERNRDYERNRQRAWLKHVRRIKEDSDYFEKFKKYALWVSVGSLMLALTFFADYGLTSSGPVETVLEKQYLYPITQEPVDREYYNIVTREGNHRIYFELVDPIRPGDRISLKQSPIFGMTLGIDVMKNDQLVRIKNPAVEAGFRFFSLLLGVSILTFFYKDKNEWAVNLTLINLLLLAINSLMLMLSITN